jgi:hypothetical protein
MVAYLVIKITALASTIGSASALLQMHYRCLSLVKNVNKFGPNQAIGIYLLNLITLEGKESYDGLLKYIRNNLSSAGPVSMALRDLLNRFDKEGLDIEKCNAELIASRDSFIKNRDSSILPALHTVINTSNVTVLHQNKSIYQSITLSIPILCALNHVFRYTDQRKLDTFQSTLSPNNDTGRDVLDCIAASNNTTFGTLLYSIAQMAGQGPLIKNFLDALGTQVLSANLALKTPLYRNGSIEELIDYLTKLTGILPDGEKTNLYSVWRIEEVDRSECMSYLTDHYDFLYKNLTFSTIMNKKTSSKVVVASLNENGPNRGFDAGLVFKMNGVMISDFIRLLESIQLHYPGLKPIPSTFVAPVLPHPHPEPPKKDSKVDPPSTKPESKECVICFERQPKIAFMTCGHFVCCEECSKPVQTCPICRKEITSKVKIYGV